MQVDPIARREALRRLLAEGKPRTQLDLVSALERAGFPSTQATVCRDLRVLGTVKAAGRYSLPTASAGEGGADEAAVLGRCVVRARAAGDGLVVVQTGAGSAQRAALAIDRLGWEDVVGTLAGDDTIFVACADRKAQRAVLRRMEAMRQGASS